MDAVSEVLLDRSREADKATRMVILSLAVHAALITAMAFAPSRNDAPNPADVMTITFGGPVGPIQGKNAISAPPVEVAAPEAVKPRVQPAPPAVAKPEMIEPVKAAKPLKPTAKPQPDKPEARSTRPPTQGPEVKAGTARTETQGAAIPWGGLATGGGGDGGVTTDFANFCCPDYLMTLKRAIYGNWQKKQGQAALNQVRFTVSRDGSISEVTVEKSAGQFLDLMSRRAIEQTQRLPPLPAAFTPPRLTVHLEFEYIR